MAACWPTHSCLTPATLKMSSLITDSTALRIILLEFQVHATYKMADAWVGSGIGEILSCSREGGNREDHFAVAVQKSSAMVGQVPRRISCVCSLFLRQGGTIVCTVTASKRQSVDLCRWRCHCQVNSSSYRVEDSRRRWN